MEREYVWPNYSEVDLECLFSDWPPFVPARWSAANTIMLFLDPNLDAAPDTMDNIPASPKSSSSPCAPCPPCTPCPPCAACDDNCGFDCSPFAGHDRQWSVPFSMLPTHDQSPTGYVRSAYGSARHAHQILSPPPSYTLSYTTSYAPALNVGGPPWNDSHNSIPSFSSREDLAKSEGASPCIRCNSASFSGTYCRGNLKRHISTRHSDNVADQCRDTPPQSCQHYNCYNCGECPGCHEPFSDPTSALN